MRLCCAQFGLIIIEFQTRFSEVGLIFGEIRWRQNSLTKSAESIWHNFCLTMLAPKRIFFFALFSHSKITPISPSRWSLHSFIKMNLLHSPKNFKKSLTFKVLYLFFYCLIDKFRGPIFEKQILPFWFSENLSMFFSSFFNYSEHKLKKTHSEYQVWCDSSG